MNLWRLIQDSWIARQDVLTEYCPHMRVNYY